MLWYLIYSIVGLIFGILIGVVIENASATRYLKKSQEEITAKNEVIKNLSRQVRQLRHEIK